MRVRSLCWTASLALWCWFLTVDAHGQATVIEGGTLIDGNGGTPVADAVIVVEGETIARISQKGRVQYPAGAKVISAEGKFILPGLWDAHVHYREWMPELLITHGITSILITSSNDWIMVQKEGQAKGKLFGPRMFVAQVFDAYQRGTVPGNTVRTPEEARNRVRDAIKSGEYDVVKAYVTITPELLKAMAEEAHAAGKPVMGHIGISAKSAALAGIDMITHGSGIAIATTKDPDLILKIKVDGPLYMADYAYLPPEYVRKMWPSMPHHLMALASMDPALADDLIQTFLRENVYVDLNLQTIATGASPRWEARQLEDHLFLNNPDLAYLPENFRQRVLYYSPLRYQILNSAEKELFQKGYKNLQNFIKQFVQAGGKVLASSGGASFDLTGVSLHRELEDLVSSGLTPLQAIQAATKNTAEFLRVSDRLGTVEVGKLADLIIVKGDPLENISNTRNIEAVLQNGKVQDLGYHAWYANPIPEPRGPELVGHPTPHINRLSPRVLTQAGKPITLTIEGTGFISQSVVKIDGTGIPANIETPNRIVAQAPVEMAANVGTFYVTVTNPKPIGGTSNEAYFIVTY